MSEASGFAARSRRIRWRVSRDVRAALWGDLDDDGLLDVVLCRPAGGTQIWKQSPAGRWVDATAASGVRLGSRRHC